jgi:hypothetical protein
MFKEAYLMWFQSPNIHVMSPHLQTLFTSLAFLTHFIHSSTSKIIPTLATWHQPIICFRGQFTSFIQWRFSTMLAICVEPVGCTK